MTQTTPPPKKPEEHDFAEAFDCLADLVKLAKKATGHDPIALYDIITDCSEAIRASLLQAQDVKVVGVEELKRQYVSPTHPELFPNDMLFTDAWNKCIDHLAQSYPAGLVLKGGE
jgi:hypothetical protein